jgi:anaerobic selenocysteine-containing dehydrogenase
MDCPDTCAVEVDVEPGDGGVDRVVALRGAADHPTTRGFLCSKVARFAERLDGPERLLHPLRRTGAKGTASFARISWEEALAEITGRFRHAVETWGGEAILPFHYGGSNGLLAEDFLDDLYFARLGASRLAKTICAAPATAVATAMYGKMPGVSHEDFVHARAIVLWGANPKSSHIHLVPFLKEAGRRGAFVATVDPERHFSEAEVDLHLPVLPGADLPLALAIAHRWQEQGRLDSAFLERWTRGADALLAAAAAWDLPRAAAACGVEEGAIARLADAWSDASPALLRLGWGVERNRNGGQAMAAILALPALGGKLGVKGGGYTLSNSGWARLDPSRVLGAVPWDTRVVNMNRLGAWLAPERGVPDPQDPAFPPRPPVQALFVYNANPVATVPDQRSVLAGLAREDLFTVVFEQVMTDTARWADVVLPAITFLEGWELKRSYGSYGLGGIRPAVAPRGEARSNPQVFAALGRAMGFADEAFGWDDETLLARAAAAVVAGGGPADGARLAAGGWVRPAPEDLPVQLGNVFPATADGLVHLAPAELGRQPFRWLPPDAGRAPLALISPADPRRISSSLGELGRQDLAVTLHPADAAARGIASGDRVRVFNELGEVVCPARLSDRLRPGVARLPKGAWQRHSQNGETANALCPSTLGFAGGACFNDARVEVEML